MIHTGARSGAISFKQVLGRTFLEFIGKIKIHDG